jgi:hypothetical protein
LGSVFVVGDVADPVEAVLDAPVAGDEAVEVVGAGLVVGEVGDVDPGPGPTLVIVLELGFLVFGAAIGFAVNEVLGRGVRAVERRRARSDPLVVHVETDPSVIWAGMPPWIGAGFLVPPDADVASPPAHCPDWRSWIHERGGVDESLTQLRVTLTARKDLTAVVDGLRVRVRERRPVPAWRSITCPAGGADISPRRAEVRLSDFDPPIVSWVDEGAPIHVPTFSLTAGETEMLHVWAYAGDEWVEWTAELLAIVDGQRKVIEISEGGHPFVTTGAAGASSQHMWLSWERRWEPPIPI